MTGNDIAEVIDIIALELGAPPTLLRSGGKAAALTGNRRLAIHVARLVTGAPVTELAAYFGCEGQTVERACRQTDAERAREPKLQETLNYLVSLCGGRAPGVVPLPAAEATPLARVREVPAERHAPRGVSAAANQEVAHVTAPAKIGAPPRAAIQQTTGPDSGSMAAYGAGLHDASSGWTGAREQRLTTLWNEGKSAAEIAIELGGGITRNAVIGKAHRFGLAERASPIIRRDIPNASIIDLPPRLCHWPIGDPKLPDFHFCAAPVDPKAPRNSPGPYCAQHIRAAYPPKVRRDQIEPIQWRGGQTKVFA